MSGIWDDIAAMNDADLTVFLANADFWQKWDDESGQHHAELRWPVGERQIRQIHVVERTREFLDRRIEGLVTTAQTILNERQGITVDAADVAALEAVLFSTDRRPPPTEVWNRVRMLWESLGKSLRHEQDRVRVCARVE